MCEWLEAYSTQVRKKRTDKFMFLREGGNGIAKRREKRAEGAGKHDAAKIIN